MEELVMETEDVDVLLNTQVHHAQDVCIILYNKLKECQNLYISYSYSSINGNKSRCARLLKFKYFQKGLLFISINNLMRHMKYIQFGVLIQCAQLKLIYFASYQMERFF